MAKQNPSAVLIGYGSVGGYHARLLNDRYPQLAIVDFTDQARERVAADYPEAIAKGSLAELDDFGWPWETSTAVIATWGPNHRGTFDELAELGVKHILCEKPLAHSISAGTAMIQSAEKLGITLGVHQHLRYSGLVSGLRARCQELDLGEPCSMFMHAGAIGMITRGIHWIDLACELFDGGPEWVVGSVTGDPINPRSPDLMFYGGTAVWSFGKGREVSFCLSNSSSIDASINIYYRNAVVRVLRNLDIEICRRDSGDLERYPSVTRVGMPVDVAFAGPVPGLQPIENRTSRLYEEIESGKVSTFPPAMALQSLGACIGALESGQSGQCVSLPIGLDTDLAKKEWPMS